MADSSPTPRKLGKSAERMLNLLLVVASVAITLAIAEVAVRVLAPQTADVAPTADQYRFHAFDPKLGWVNRPGAQGEFRRAEFAYPIRINSQGMRDAEVPPARPAGATRIAVLGDSFTWGIGVADADRFTDLVEKGGGGRYEVLNFGVSGYGPVQYYLQLDDVVRQRPRLVLLTFCLGNDFADNVFWKRYGYYKPYVDEPAEGAPEIKGYPLPHVGEFVSSDSAPLRWLIENSRLIRMIARGLSQRRLLGLGSRQAGLTALDETQANLYTPAADPKAAEARTQALVVNRQILAAIKARLDREGIDLAVVIAPTKCEFGLCFLGRGEPNWTLRDALTRTLADLKIDVVDPSEAMTASDFWETDGHWRPSGHQKVAAAVLPWLEVRTTRPARSRQGAREALRNAGNAALEPFVD